MATKIHKFHNVPPILPILQKGRATVELTWWRHRNANNKVCPPQSFLANSVPAVMFHKASETDINYISLIIIYLNAGPALASAGPDWKQFGGAPHSVVCRNFWRGLSSHKHRNHEWCERTRPEKGNAKLEVSGGMPEMSGLWNFSVRVQPWSEKIESDPVLIRKILKIASLIQSWSAKVKSCIFILPHEAKELLELFCL